MADLRKTLRAVEACAMDREQVEDGRALELAFVCDACLDLIIATVRKKTFKKRATRGVFFESVTEEWLRTHGVGEAEAAKETGR